MTRAEASTKYHKDRAWKAFSQYIRTRDCLETTGDPTRGYCCTCKQSVMKVDGHAGHFLAGRGNGILFDERGTNLQCYHCNIELAGNYPEYLKFMINKHGEKVVTLLENLKRQTVKLYSSDYREIQRKYVHKLAILRGGGNERAE